MENKDGFYKIIIRNNKLLFAIFISTIVFLIVTIPVPKFNGDISGFNLEKNEEFINYQKTDSIFKNRSKIYLEVIPYSDNRKEIQKEIQKISQEITSKYINSSVTSPLPYYNKMIRHWKIKNNQLSTFLKQAKEVPELKKLISNDLKSFLVIISFDDFKSIDIDYLNSIFQRPSPEIKKINVFSIAHLETSIEKYVTKDVINLTLLILIFFSLYIIFSFRDFKALIFMGFTILGPISISLLVFYFLNVQVNLISLLVFPIVLILALSDSIHLLTGYVKFNHIKNRDIRTEKVIANYFIPSFFSSLTTSAAFLSFYFFNDSVFIQQFGMITSIALMLEFLIVFSIAPFLLSRLHIKKINDYNINMVSNFLFKNKKTITVGLIIVLITSLTLVNKLSVRTSSDIFFPLKSEISHVRNRLMDKYYSTIKLDILLSSKEEKNNNKQIIEDYIIKLNKRFENEALIVNTSSSLDKFYFKTRYGVKANLFNFLGNGNPYYDEKTNTQRIELKFKSSKDVVDFSKGKLLEIINDSPKEINISYSSMGLVLNEMNNSITTSLIKSLLSSGLVIFLIILIMTKSILASLLSLLPNLIPLGFIIIIYYIFNININVITALTAVISIGLLDDDTVHILYRKFWLKKPMEELSFSILSSAIILTICFAFFMTSSFKPIVAFGWVSSLIFIIGIISEMTLMQWILQFFGKNKIN